MEKIEIESQINLKEYIKLMYSLTYRRPLMIIMTIVGLLIVIVSLKNAIVRDHWVDFPYQTLFFGIILLIFIPASIYWNAKKNFNSTPRIKERMVYTFEPEEFHILGESFNSSMSWDKVFKVQETKGWLLIYHNKIVASLIPRSSFSAEEYRQVKDLISAHPEIQSNLKI